MNKWLKIFSTICAVLVALVIALIVLASVLITPERVKETLLPLAEENLHRKIDLGKIEVSLFSGIEIHGLKLYEKNGNDVFISTDMARLKYQLLPLLAMKVVVDEVRLEKPSIRVVRLKDGQFNFSDLVDGEDSEKTKITPPKDAQAQNQEGGSNISLLVSNLLLQDGQLIFFDHVLNDAAPYRYEIAELQVAAKGVSLSGEIPLTVKCQLNGSPLTLDGRVKLQPFSVDFDVALQDLDIVPFSPYFKESLPGKLGGMSLTIKSNLFGTFEDAALKGAISLSKLDLLLEALPEAPLEEASVNVDFDLLLAHASDQLQINSLNLDFNGIKVKTAGKIESPLTTPFLDLIITFPGLKIREAIDAVPAGLVGDVSSLDPAGSISAEAVLKGSVDVPLALLKSARLDLEDVQATTGGQRPAFSGRLLLSGDNLRSEDLMVRLGDNNADIDLTARRIFSEPVIVTADVTSERFLLEPLLKGSAAPVAAQDIRSEVTNKQNSTDEIGPFQIPVHATGTISVAEALWKGLEVGDFVAQYELKDNVLNLSRIDGKVAGGGFAHSARVDLGKKGLAYSVALGLHTIQADALLKAFFPGGAGKLLGTMDLSFDLEGRGSQWQTISQNLSGAGEMAVANGRLDAPVLVAGLRALLQQPEMNDLQFDDFEGQLKIVKGKVQVDGELLSRTLKIFTKGTVGLDGSVNLGLDTRLSPELSSKLDKSRGALGYLADKDGWTQLPLLLMGSLDAPRFTLDPKGVKAQASKALANELGAQIDKLFKKSDPASQEKNAQNAKENPEDPTRKLLQDSLQKLFGD